MSPTRADERLLRLLAIVPWVVAQDGPRVEEVCRRFGITESELVADLDLLFLCGLHPYTPDMLIEVDIADGRVWIRYADYFSRPLRLTAAEALAVVAAGAALLALPGTHGEGPLARGLAKLAGVLGLGEAVEVDLGPTPQAVLATLQEAAAGRRQVEIDYYAYGRDERATRRIEPWSVFSAGGQWYVVGHCHRAAGERVFRVDRVRAARALETTFTPPPPRPAPAVYTPRPDDPMILLELGPAARWVVEQYPHEGVEELGGGRCRVRLRVSERGWLERLLLRLGHDGRVVEGPEAVGAAAAARLLRRYRSGTAVRSGPT
jgi:proteasome accessory factor C